MGKLRIEITQRDNTILNILKKIAYLREDLLAKYLNLDYNLKKDKLILNVLAFRLKEHQIIQRQKLLHAGLFYWSLANNGAKLINSITPKNPNLMTLNHDDYCAQLTINLLLKNSDDEVQTEYEIKQSLFGNQAREKKIPDITLNKHTAIEIELSAKDNKRNLLLVNAYNNSEYNQVIYYSNNKLVINKLLKLVNNNDRFKFKLFQNNILHAQDFTTNSKQNIIKSSANDIDKNSKVNNLLKELNLL